MKTARDFFKSDVTPNPPITNLKPNFNDDKVFLEQLVEKKRKVHESLMLNFSGTTTTVTYFSKLTPPGTENMRNSTTSSTITTNIDKYRKINNLEVKLEDNINISNEGDDIAKSYVRNGVMKILPNTITPYAGDFFAFNYMGRPTLFQVNTVNKEAQELNSSWIVEFEIAVNGENFDYDSWNLKSRVQEEVYFVAAHIGTNYKTIVTKSEQFDLETLKSFYNYLGRIYNSYFFNKTLNVYLLKNVYFHDPEETQTLIKQVNSNNNIYHDMTYYDNFLNYFMRKDGVFSIIDDKIITPSTIAGFQELDYLSSIFSAISNKDKDMLRYKFTDVEHISSCSTYIPPTLFGFEYVKHVNYTNNMTVELFPNNFYDTIDNFNYLHLTKFEDRIYNTDTALMVEIIALYLNKVPVEKEHMKNDELHKRLLYLNERKEKLLVDNIFSQHIFYLYPLIGFIINDLLKFKYIN